MRLVAIIIAASLVTPLPASACTYATREHGVEVQPSLIVGVTFAGTALAGVTVELMALKDGRKITVATSNDGSVRVNNLRPGQYLIDVRLYGVSAGSDQIEVRSRPTSAAKAKLDYQWGTSPTAVRSAVGTIVDTRPWFGIDLLNNIVGQRKVPMAGLRVKLKDPTGPMSFATATTDRGEFAFSGVPNGYYVMRIQTSPNEYGSTVDYGSFLIELRTDAVQETVKLWQSHWCGDHLELVRN